ncbi:MAG TPA: hypothetical protein VKE40_04425 [Gemmataceae bacterium]|nr:hypothetical protein [Gemmataceae bacterium]
MSTTTSSHRSSMARSTRRHDSQSVANPNSTSGWPCTTGENTTWPARSRLAVARQAVRNRSSRTAASRCEYGLAR